METVEMVRESEASTLTTEATHAPALSKFLGRAAWRRGTGEEAQHARQALQDSLDLREQGYAGE